MLISDPIEHLRYSYSPFDRIRVKRYRWFGVSGLVEEGDTGMVNAVDSAGVHVRMDKDGLCCNLSSDDIEWTTTQRLIKEVLHGAND